MGVLEGVRILEIAGLGPGPFCGMLLADMGADVIVVERPLVGAKPARPADIVNRGKRSIVLDMKSPAAVDIVLRLIDDADALIEGMRPGVMERLGLGPDICLARRPSLVYGRMTGWGQHGPLAQAAGHDSNFTGLSGALWFSAAPGQPPVAAPTLLGDIGGGALYLALGIVSGVLRARADGRGQVIDAAIVDGAAHMLNLLLGGMASRDGSQRFVRGESIFDAPPWMARSYRCADGGWINLCPLEPKFYRQLLDLTGLDDDPRFIEGQMNPAVWPDLARRMTELFASRPRAHWCALLEGSDVCFAPVLDPGEAASHPHLMARGVYCQVDGILQAAPAPRFSATPSKSCPSVPARGVNTREILLHAGFPDEEITQLNESGAIHLGMETSDGAAPRT